MSQIKSKLIYSITTFIVIIFIVNCAPSANISPAYVINKISNNTIPLKVGVTKFQDIRPKEEKNKNEREKLKFSDLDDYTYDTNFVEDTGDLAEQLTKMTVTHFQKSKVFNEVIFVDLSTDDINNKKIDGFSEKEIDLLLTGKINHYYGYYNRRSGDELGRSILGGLLGGLATGPIVLSTQPSIFVGNIIIYFGVYMGMYSGMYTIDHQVKAQISIDIELINTTNNDTLYTNTFESKEEKIVKIFGRSPKTNIIAVNTVKNLWRNTVNKIGEEISNNYNTLYDHFDNKP